MIPKRKKINILDIVILREDMGLLKHRISNSYKKVSEIILINTSKNYTKSHLKNELSPWIDKINWFDTEDSENIFNKTNIEEFYFFLKKLNLNFEDIICFSEITELPEFSDFEVVSESLLYQSTILRNTNFVFNLIKHTKNRHIGTLCTTYSMILNRPFILTNLTETKNKEISDDFNMIDNGYNFDYFQSEEQIIDSFQKLNIKIDKNELLWTISKSLSPEFLKNNRRIYFSDFELEIPFDFSFLNQFNYEENLMGKSLIIFNMYQIKVEKDYLDIYNRVFNFNFTEDYRYDETSETENLETINIFLPNKQIYNSHEQNFNLSFGLREVKKILKKSNLLNEQICDVVILGYEPKPVFELSIKWKDLKKDDFIEKFYNLLVQFI